MVCHDGTFDSTVPQNLEVPCSNLGFSSCFYIYCISKCSKACSVQCKDTNASFTPVRHLCSVVRHPSSVISRPLQSLPFTPIRLSRAVDTDFCVPTVLNRYSPGKWLTEALFVGNSLSTAHYHDLWSASVIRRPLKSLPDRF